MNNADHPIKGELNQKRQQLISESLKSHLSQIFGYHALLYSPLAKSICGQELCIKHQIIIDQLINQTIENEKLSFVCRYEELPISSDCIDLAILPNILQNSPNPHQVLREVERVLIPEGVVVLIGRNPFSWLGIKSIFIRWSKKKESLLTDISKRRVVDWLGLLGFETEKQLNISVSNQALLNSTNNTWLKKISELFCRCFCSYYIIIASKKVSTLTPIRPSWRSNKQLVPSRVTEPNVRAKVKSMFKQVK